MRRYVSAAVAVANRQRYRGGTPYIYAAGVWNGGESRADLTQSRRREHAPRHKKATGKDLHDRRPYLNRSEPGAAAEGTPRGPGRRGLRRGPQPSPGDTLGSGQARSPVGKGRPAPPRAYIRGHHDVRWNADHHGGDRV